MTTLSDKALEPGELFDPRFTREMNLAQRMHLVMTRVDYIQKDKPQAPEGGKALKYSIVSHDAVTALIREHTVACGIVYYPVFDRVERDGNITIVQLRVIFCNIDQPAEMIEVGGLGYGIDQGDKGPGKAISYAVKYALLKGFGLETGDDPDFDQEVKRKSSTQQRADELEKAMLAAPDAASLGIILTEPTVDPIFQALSRDDPAEYRRLRATVATEAKRTGLDLKALAKP
jgi:hypothetical protein